MHTVERCLLQVRHARLWKRAGWFWSVLRPAYEALIRFVGRRGLVRCINGTDPILVLPSYRNVPEEYEPELWTAMTSSVTAGDTVVDVGAYIGLYAVACAHRVEVNGQVFAFEPDPHNAAVLRSHVSLNGLESRIQIVEAAVCSRDARVQFRSGLASESRLADAGDTCQSPVQGVTLDAAFPTTRIDIMKIDVEGYEELALRGARSLLTSERRRPRAVYIEVHPYAWQDIGTSDDSLLGLLHHLGYYVFDLKGSRLLSISEYGSVVARPS